MLRACRRRRGRLAAVGWPGQVLGGRRRTAAGNRRRPPRAGRRASTLPPRQHQVIVALQSLHGSFRRQWGRGWGSLGVGGKVGVAVRLERHPQSVRGSLRCRIRRALVGAAVQMPARVLLRTKSTARMGQTEREARAVVLRGPVAAPRAHRWGRMLQAPASQALQRMRLQARRAALSLAGALPT